MQALEVVCGASRLKRKQESSVAMVEDPGHPASFSRSRSARHQDGREELGDSEGGRSEASSSRPRAPHREQPRGCTLADSDIPRRCKRPAPQEEVYTSSEEDGKLDETDGDTDPSASDQGGHDNRQPKR
jgi:hypothetical protein